MDHELAHKIHVVIGIFTISCLAMSFFYGQAIVILLVGLLSFAVLRSVISDRHD